MTFEAKLVHSGQKRQYGHSYYEYEIEGIGSYEEVLKFCTEVVCKCGLSRKKWENDSASAGSYFRSSFELRRLSERKWLYQIMSPYTG